MGRPFFIMQIYLIGFMGCGKSFMGSKLAKLLDIPFIDSDTLIEKDMKMSISVIFRKLGESEFRRLETNMLMSFNADAVFATGGGVVESIENCNFIKDSKAIVIWLNPTWANLYQRIRNSARPLVKGRTETELKTLFNSRKVKYSELSDIIYTGSSAQELLAQIKKPG